MRLEDPIIESDDTMKSRSRLILLLYFLVLALVLVPFSGVIGGAPLPIVGIPATMAWLIISLLGFPIIAFIGYRYLFQEWAERTDKLLGEE